MTATFSPPILIVGNPDPIHVGSHLYRAARTCDWPVTLCDTTAAYKAAWPLRQINWRLRGHRPARLAAFSRHVLDTCETFRPACMITTGLAPLNRDGLQAITQMGIPRLNYLTDDPWNPVHHAPWFLRTLPLYDHVFSPRKRNMDDLKRLGCRVSYLPFAYDPEQHAPPAPLTPDEQVRFDCDVVFAGGADRDRMPYLAALIREGFNVALYGGYWDKNPETRPYARGHADTAVLRKAITGARIALCMVRRANRDGHVMRTFEVPATGGCMLTEDTDEHRALFGADGENVVYFSTIPGMIEKTQWLLTHDGDRRGLADKAHRLIVNGKHTYQDRLHTMLACARIMLE